MPLPRAGLDQSDDPVIQFVERILAAILREFLRPVPAPSITLKRRPLTRSSGNSERHGTDMQGPSLEADPQDHYMTYSWPGETPYEAWKFSCALRVLCLIHETVMTKSIITKRFWRAALLVVDTDFLLNKDAGISTTMTRCYLGHSGWWIRSSTILPIPLEWTGPRCVLYV
ncbi:hypothetical protein VTN31DRAFT_4985 [Thermomyces dupontii]|uniref:uncharacterized protein n=1 Tax=Talaromyces thermophilus TaxID=28565 RepID=UPI00374482CC